MKGNMKERVQHLIISRANPQKHSSSSQEDNLQEFPERLVSESLKAFIELNSKGEEKKLPKKDQANQPRTKETQPVSKLPREIDSNTQCNQIRETKVDPLKVENEESEPLKESRSSFYLNDYASSSLKTLHELKLVLKRESIAKMDPHSRRRLFNWILEVCNYYGKHSSIFSFFRAVFIFLKNVQDDEKFNEKQAHLLGLTSVYMAMKLEEVKHPSLSDLAEAAGHGKFTSEDISLCELRILKNLSYNAYFPTSLDFLLTLFTMNFDENSQKFEATKNFAVYLLRLTLVNEELLLEDPMVIAFCCLAISMFFYFKSRGVHFTQQEPSEKVSQLKPT